MSPSEYLHIDRLVQPEASPTDATVVSWRREHVDELKRLTDRDSLVQELLQSAAALANASR